MRAMRRVWIPGKTQGGEPLGKTLGEKSGETLAQKPQEQQGWNP